MKQDMHLPTEQLTRYLHTLRKNMPLLVFVFLVAVYGYLSWQIFSIMRNQPTDDQVAAKLKTIGVPQIDPHVVTKITQLKDNSVSVQALFNDQRQNPFSE